MFLFRLLFGRIILFALVLLVAAGAGWWFFIREDNGVQKQASAVNDDVLAAASAQAARTTTPAAGSSTPASGAVAEGASSVGGRAFQIVEGQSQAWYLAPEKLSRLPTSSVAKGTTKGITGEFHLASGGLDASKPTQFTVDLKSLASDERMRDTRMHNALETTKFPTATFTATKLTGMPAEFTSAETVMQLTGILKVHGVEKEVTWELKAKQEQGILSGLATTKFKYSDFGINKPEVAGFVTVEDEVTIQVQIFARPLEA